MAFSPPGRPKGKTPSGGSKREARSVGAFSPPGRPKGKTPSGGSKREARSVGAKKKAP